MSETTVSGSILRVNDIELFYEVRGRGEPVLLLHGFTGAGIDWSLVFGETPFGFELIVPDLRGHGRSTNPGPEFTHRQAALDMFGLLDHLGIGRCRAVGLSAGAGVLLHMATSQPARIASMVLISGASHFPEQARAIMGHTTAENRSAWEWAVMRQRHKRGDDQIRALWSQANSFKDSHDDLNFSPALLSKITAPTLIVYGDRDPLYPVELAVEMFRAVPRSYLWIVPNGGHGPIFGEKAVLFVETALAFLRGKWGAEPAPL